jgi:hypothetical protein
MVREGKASLEADLASIFERLKLDGVVLESTAAKLFQPAHRVPNQLGKAPAQSVRHRAKSPMRVLIASTSQFSQFQH